MAGIVHFGRRTRGNGVLGGGRGRMVSVITVCIALIAGSFAAGAAADQASGPMQGFTVTPADLSFILKQIKIAEAHVANTTAETGPCGALVGLGPDQINSPLISEGLRTVDGSCNNLQPGQETFGAADQVFPRLAPPDFRTAEARPLEFGPGGTSTSYAQTKGSVFDSQPRTISNLIVDQTSTNPAAVAAAGHPVRSQSTDPSAVPCETEVDGSGDVVDSVPATPVDCTPKGGTLFIPNITTDVGLSPPFNSLFTLFGQFFDHGLDKITNGGSGTVFVPLKPDDDLYNPEPGSPNFMVVTRSTNRPGPDGRTGDDPATVGVDESADDIHEALNTDSPWVDQSQTYASHASHQVFLREYQNNAAGLPVSTGRLLGLADGGMATWGLLKAQAATMLGLQIVDTDVGNIPMIAADAYGKFIPVKLTDLPVPTPDELGMAQYVTPTGLVRGNRTTPVPVPANATRIETAFLNDIAHSAAPTNGGPDTDDTAGGSLDPTVPAGSYDNELLDMHFTAGDGRTNENIGLTAIHQIFHSEHDRLVDDIKATLVADTSGVTNLADWQTASGAAGWNGERLFQAARFVTEMEYQHLVFEEFARKVQPAINAFEPFAFTQTNIDPAIVAEFAHAVYRFGHSMLTETISRTNADGSTNDIPLFDGFLNPKAYTDGGSAGTLTSKEAAGSIIMGMTDQTGNEIDEFVTDVLRNRLVGLPLDLPSINIARGRAEGIPRLNDLRRSIFAATNDGQLAPYANWIDFGLGLKHPESLINFVAAYGQHPTVLAATTTEGKRAAARAIVNPLPDDVMPLDAFEFLDGTGPWATDPTGLDDVDAWMGGLAENTNVFGGHLGSTFNYVFEYQLTHLQNDDRLYYLARTPGMNLRSELEGNSFGELMMRNTNAHSLKADTFATADCKFELDNLAGTAAGYAAFGSTVADDPKSECDENALLIRRPDGQIRYRSTNTVDPAGINGQSVYNGTDGPDRVYGGNDNDTFIGGKGADIIDGGAGDDAAAGGEGNDIMTDFGGADVSKGGPGNDAIDSGVGDDIIMGGAGNDFTNGGANINETFGGAGNDFMILGQSLDAGFGDGGDDWMEGGDQPDLLQGEGGSLFFDDHNLPGHDVLIGQAGDDDYDMEGGDDIGVADPGIEKNAGAAGYDWVVNVGDPQPADADLALVIVEAPIGVNGVRDKYNEVEALSGWKFNDILRGDSIVPADVGGGGFIGCDALDQSSLDRISGLDPLIPDLGVLGGDVVPSAPIIAAAQTHHCRLQGNVWGGGNVLLGGAGSDLIEGRGGNDVIDGDRWLNVRLSVRTDPADAGTELGTTNLMETTATSGNFGPGTAGMTLQQAVFAGKVDPGNIVIVREILSSPGDLDIDTALFSDIEANYTITAVPGPGRKLIVSHNAAGDDGTDTVSNVEVLQFAGSQVLADGLFNNPATGMVTISSLPATEGIALTADASTIADLDGFAAGSVSLDWQMETTPDTWISIDGGNGPTFTPTNLEVGHRLHVTATFVDNKGFIEIITSMPTDPVINVNDTPTGVPTLSDTTPAVSVAVTANTASIGDPDGLGVFSFQWTANGAPIALATGPSFTPTLTQLGQVLRVEVSFTDLHGTAESVVSAASDPVAPAPVPVAVITPGSLAFGNQATGTTSASQAITVSNTGDGVLVVGAVSKGGSNPGQFTQLSNGCTAPVLSGGSCTITFAFAPTTVGLKAMGVSIAHNAPGSPEVVVATGTGVTPAPAVLLSPPALAFASQDIGTTSAPLVTTVTNTGTANLLVGLVTLDGANPGQFARTTTCQNTTVVPGGTCTVSVTFRPTTAGAKSARINIADNAPANPHLVTLTGTATVPVTTVAIPATLGFGIRRINTNTVRTFRVTNNGPGALVINSITSSSARFTVARGTCPAATGTLAAGARCDLNVTFRPTAVGPVTGVLTLNSSATNSPSTATLTGTGRN